MSDSKHTPNNREKVLNLNEIVAIVVKLAVLLFFLFVALRIPPIWFKLIGSLAVLIFGWRWLRGSSKKRRAEPSNLTPFEEGKFAEARQDYRSAIEYYETAIAGNLKPNQIAVRLLVCYDAAGEVGRAKTMIQKLDGGEFPDSVADELESVAANYFPITLKRAPNGVRLKLI